MGQPKWPCTWAPPGKLAHKAPTRSSCACFITLHRAGRWRGGPDPLIVFVLFFDLPIIESFLAIYILKISSAWLSTRKKISEISTPWKHVNIFLGKQSHVAIHGINTRPHGIALHHSRITVDQNHKLHCNEDDVSDQFNRIPHLLHIAPNCMHFAHGERPSNSMR